MCLVSNPVHKLRCFSRVSMVWRQHAKFCYSLGKPMAKRHNYLTSLGSCMLSTALELWRTHTRLPCTSPQQIPSYTVSFALCSLLFLPPLLSHPTSFSSPFLLLRLAMSRSPSSLQPGPFPIVPSPSPPSAFAVSFATWLHSSSTLNNPKPPFL